MCNRKVANWPKRAKILNTEVQLEDNWAKEMGKLWLNKNSNKFYKRFF